MSAISQNLTPSERIYAALLERTGEAAPEPRLGPVRRLAELAGSPQLQYPVIQVAGTNGKTSTSRAIQTLLSAHGVRSGLFTSPHLIDFTERFQIDGQPIDAELLESIWDELQLPLSVVDAELEAKNEPKITFFEALVVLGFAVFADAPVDVAVIEVGMGGEWDATNIVDATVAVFTPIGLDHTEILGDTIAKIAKTKSGIIKQGATVVSAAQDDSALAEIAAAAVAHDAKLYVAGTDFSIGEDRLAVGGRQVDFVGITGHAYEPAFVPLFGHHQAANTSLAIAAVEAFFGAERPIPDEVLEEGLGHFTSPGRLQLISKEPVTYVDAAHNPHGAEALVRAVTESFSFSELAIVVGVLGEKDAAGLLRTLAPIAHRVYATAVDSPRSLEADRIAELAEDAIPETPVLTVDAFEDAVADAHHWAAEEDGRAVLIVGSVVLAGQALALSHREDWGIA